MLKKQRQVVLGLFNFDILDQRRTDDGAELLGYIWNGMKSDTADHFNTKMSHFRGFHGYGVTVDGYRWSTNVLFPKQIPTGSIICIPNIVCKQCGGGAVIQEDYLKLR